MDNDELVGYVQRYHKTVFRLAYSYVRNCADADDICQDAFVKLMDYSGKFASEDDCKRWLVRVVINLFPLNYFCSLEKFRGSAFCQ